MREVQGPEVASDAPLQMLVSGSVVGACMCAWEGGRKGGGLRARPARLLSAPPTTHTPAPPPLSSTARSQITNLDYDEHKGRIAIGRVRAGQVRRGASVVFLKPGEQRAASPACRR